MLREFDYSLKYGFIRHINGGSKKTSHNLIVTDRIKLHSGRLLLAHFCSAADMQQVVWELLKTIIHIKKEWKVVASTRIGFLETW